MTAPRPSQGPQGAPDPVAASGVGSASGSGSADGTGPREEPLHARLRRAGFTLACIPYPDRPLTDDQAAEVIGAAHLLMTASVRMEAADERNARHQAAAARRERIAIGAWIAVATACLIFIAVGVTLDATH